MSTTHDSVPSSEGPLAHDARVTSEQSYLDGLAEARRDAWERASGARPERTPKRLLVALSHSIERAVMSGPIEKPTVVVALFQQLRFFDREREVYERLAEAGATVVVGFVEGAHEPPAGVHVVTLRPDEPLADEWSVVAVGSGAGAFLVATDQHAFDPAERDHEASREFVGRWGYSRAQAGTELARLRFTLGDRLDADLCRTIDHLLAEHMPAGGDPAASAGTPGETWATSSLNHMLDGMQTARAGTRELREQLADAQRAASARAAATTDPNSGVSNPDFLRRWANPTGPNPLPIGLALFEVAELDSEAMRADDRASYFAAHQVAAALSQPLGPVDAVVRMSAREFLLVVPGASDRHLAGLCDRIGEQLELASHGYPGISLRARVATVVTRVRPLPVDDLHASIARLTDGEPGPLDAGQIPAGDRIVVSSTALHAPASSPPAPSPTPAAGRSTAEGPPAAGRRPEEVAGAAPVEGTPPTARDQADTVPPQPRPEVSPLGHTAGTEDGRSTRSAGGAAATPRPGTSAGPTGPAADGGWSTRRGAHRSADESAGTPSGPVPSGPTPERSAVDDPAAGNLPQRTAQEALRRLVYGDGQSGGGDARARSDVFTDLSDPPNGRPGPGW